MTKAITSNEEFLIKSLVLNERQKLLLDSINMFSSSISIRSACKESASHFDKILSFRHPETDVIIGAFREVHKHSARTLLPWRDAIVATGSVLVSRRETRSQRAGSLSFVTHVGRFVARLTQHPGQPGAHNVKACDTPGRRTANEILRVLKGQASFSLLFSSFRCCAIITRLVLAAIVVNSRDR